jgi:catechol 2,3-dioxygenase
MQVTGLLMNRRFLVTVSPYTMPAEISFGPLALTISDLAQSSGFYQKSIGLQLLKRQGNVTRLGTKDGRELLILTENAGAKAAKRATGLYHFAIKLPSRADLAASLYHLMESGTSLGGFADHGVSEAIYLADPDGNGIEIYRDRPRDEWPMKGEELLMDTRPLDLNGLLGELEERRQDWVGLSTEAVIGHIHLRVASIPAAEEFYIGRLGFQLMQRYGYAASFVSAGGYHHHIGFNTWESAGVEPLPPNSTGLRYFTLCLPTQDALEYLVDRLRQEGLLVEQSAAGFQIKDPSGNTIALSA